MRSDFGDVVFTAGDGKTILNYWIESYSASSNAVFWVKVGSIPAGSSTIYVYYGNASAASASNGNLVFPFFDDFSGTAVDSSKWPATSGSVVLDSGQVKLNSDAGYSYITSSAQNYTGILEFKLNYTYVDSIARFGLVANAGMYGGSYAGRGIHLWYNSAAHNLGANDPGNYHKYKMVKTSSQALWYFDGSLKKSFSIDGSIGALTFGNSGESDRKGTTWLDYAFIRPYSSSEPTYAIGPESIACVPATCSSLEKNCGTWPDNCGSNLSCGTCASGLTCNTSGQCAAASCAPNCSGKACGPDGCGSTCGACAGNLICDDFGKCTANCWAQKNKKCFNGNLYWYDSCGIRGELAKSCGNDSFVADYQCNGDWVRQGMIDRDCTDGGCVENKTWIKLQDCSLSGKKCTNGVCATNDTNPPKMSGLAPIGKIDSADISLIVVTDEPAYCRHGFNDKGFDSLGSRFNSSDKRYHSAAITLSGFGDYLFYVRCRDIAGNTNTSSAIIAFNYISSKKTIAASLETKDNDPPKIIDLSPSGQVSENQVMVSFVTSEKSDCKYDAADKKYDLMANTMDSQNGGTTHKKNISLELLGKYRFYIRCRDGYNNTSGLSTVEFEYALESGGPGPIITASQPAGIIYQKEAALAVFTDKNAACRYSLKDEDFKSMPGSLETNDGQRQIASILLDGYGDYKYYVRCQDEQGNNWGSRQVIAFTYRDPEVVPVVAAPIGDHCVQYVVQDKDGFCRTDSDCICDSDCPSKGDGADVDCASTTNPIDSGRGSNWSIVPGVILIISIVVGVVLVMRRKIAENDNQHDGEGL